MKKKRYLIALISVIYISFSAAANSADYYPELGMDPFYSSLNPTYIDEKETDTNNFTLISTIKNKKKQWAENRAAEKAKKAEAAKKKNQKQEIPTVNKQKNITDENIVETSDDTFVTKPKKPLTRAQLERELEKEEAEKEKAIEKQKEEEENLTLLEKVFNYRKADSGKKKRKNSQTQESEIPNDPNMELSADYMEYFPDRYEAEARGNAKIKFKLQGTTINADKIIFNYDRNILKAYDNVVLTSPTSTTEGDFVQIDLNKPNGWIENPITETDDIKITSKNAYIYSDNITEYEGVAKILRNDVLEIGAKSFAASDLSGVIRESEYHRINELKDGVYKIKADTIYIDAKGDHDIITLKKVTVYAQNHKVAILPTLKIVANKKHNNVETNIPEFGSIGGLGMYLGPGIVLNVPGGNTLKLVPMITYKKDFGIGGIARFRSEKNMTEIAYGTSEENLLIRGKHTLATGLTLNYSKYTPQNEWFLGFRRPRYSASLQYSRKDVVKDLNLTFSQLYSVGLFVDDKKGLGLKNNHTRFRWMTQTYKPLYSYKNNEETTSLDFGVVAQTSATVYSQGNTQGIFRIGPVLNTRVGRWAQSVMYYQTALAGQTPYDFDRYRYGRSNVLLIESFKVCKYLTLGYLVSMAMNSDYRHDNKYNDKFLQENRLLVSVGPEYAKLTFGYDAIRSTTTLFLSMMIGTKDSDIEFKKTVITNPDKFGSEKKEKKPKKKSYRKYLKEKYDPKNVDEVQEI